jgi:hemoglobin
MRMIGEYIRYSVPAERAEDFASAWSEAQQVLREAPQCERYEVSRGVEKPENFVVRIEWTSLEDHEHDFRGSAAFGQFLAAVKPFFEQIEEMRHYQPTAVRSTR